MLKRKVTPQSSRSSKRSKRAPKLRISRALVQRQVHVFHQAAVGKFVVDSLTGFRVAGGTATSVSLQIAFTQGRMVYALGAGGLLTMGDYFSTGTSLVNIFDQWRLLKVDIEMCFSRNNQQSTNQNSQSTLYACVDYDDSNALGSTQFALGYSDMKLFQLGQPTDTGGAFHKVSIWKPGFQNTVGIAAGGVSNAGTERYKWMDTAVSDVPHYGLKLLVDNPETTNAIIGYLTIICRGVYEYKNLR